MRAHNPNMSSTQPTRIIDINPLVSEIRALRTKQDELMDVIKGKDQIISQLTEQVKNLTEILKTKNNRPKKNQTKNYEDFPALPTSNRYDSLQEEEEDDPEDEDSSSDTSTVSTISSKRKKTTKGKPTKQIRTNTPTNDIIMNEEQTQNPTENTSSQHDISPTPLNKNTNSQKNETLFEEQSLHPLRQAKSNHTPQPRQMDHCNKSPTT